MKADFNIVFGDFEDLRGISRAHVLYVAQHENNKYSAHFATYPNAAFIANTMPPKDRWKSAKEKQYGDFQLSCVV
jgi:hypothetical protein